jgi:hypothetical protein
MDEITISSYVNIFLIVIMTIVTYFKDDGFENLYDHCEKFDIYDWLILAFLGYLLVII